jgi:hypothetical protein
LAILKRALAGEPTKPLEAIAMNMKTDARIRQACADCLGLENEEDLSLKFGQRLTPEFYERWRIHFSRAGGT